MQHSCSHSNAICNHGFKKRIEPRRQKHTQSSFKAQLQCGKKKTTNRPQPQPPHRRGTFHRRLQPLHGKTQGFVLWLPLHNIAHATFMQPFQCDLQPQLQETHRTTQTETHPKQLQGTVTVRQEKNDKPTAAATAAQTRYLSSSPAATLHGKTQGFVLWLPLHNIAHATFMQPFQCDLQPQLQETHRTTQTETHPKQLQSTVTLRQEKKRQTDRSRNRRTDEVPFIVACSHFTRKNTRFRALASSPQHCPCNIHAAIPMRSATTASRNA